MCSLLITKISEVNTLYLPFKDEVWHKAAHFRIKHQIHLSFYKSNEYEAMRKAENSMFAFHIKARGV